MKLSKSILKIVNEDKPKNGEEIGNGLYMVFMSTYTNLIKENGKPLAKLASSFRKKDDQKVAIDLAKKHFAPFDFNLEHEELLKDGKVNTAYQAFRQELKDVLTSELEKYGLGKAPFKLVGVLDSPSKEVQEQNPEAYNAALRNFPRFDAGGIGSCARCYNSITTHYILKSTDGKVFPLGSECVGRLNDKKVEDEAKKVALKLNKDKRDKRDDAKKDELKDILDNPDLVAKMKAIPKEKHKDYDKWPDSKKQWWDKEMGNQTYHDEVIFKQKRSGTAGNLRLLKEIKGKLGIK